MSPPGSGEFLPLAIDVETMNPARARMLTRMSSEDARNRTPSPEVRTERGYTAGLGPLRSGANSGALGNRPRRIPRSSQQPEGSRVASTSWPDAGLPRLQENINPNNPSLPKRPFSPTVKHENGYREKKPKLSTSRYYPDVETLGPAPRPDSDTLYLTSLLRNRDLFITLQYIPK